MSESELPAILDQTNTGSDDSTVNHNNNGALSPDEQQQAVNARINSFNPVVFRKFSQAIKTARVWASPDMVSNIRRDVEDIKRNLTELEALLEGEDKEGTNNEYSPE